jgi:WD40 repeat protein
MAATGGEDGTTRLFDPATGKERWQVAQQGPVRFVSFSPDNRWLVSGSADQTARVFDVRNGSEVSRMMLDGEIREARFVKRTSHRYLLTLSLDPSGTRVVVTQHLLDPADLVSDACSRLSRNLTQAEWKGFLGVEVLYHKTCDRLP